ncbi:tetratricopeptide repeat protein, partial [Brachyspira hyodysenteriae]
RGAAKKILGLYDEAIKDFDKAIELNTNNFMAYYNKGLAKSDLGHNEEAYNDFIKGYDLADDTSKKEYEQKIIDLAKHNNKAAIKICDEKGWEY